MRVSKTKTNSGPKALAALGLQSGRVLVYGLGKSGISSAHLLAHHQIPFGFYNDTEVSNYRALSSTIDWKDVPVQFGGLTADSLVEYDVVTVSPGVPAHAEAIQTIQDAGLKIISEIELAYAFAKAPVVAVTGTNGKTTTVTMADALLKKAGLKSVATGNIGYPFATAVMDAAPDYYVLEVSSFQLYHTTHFHPKVSVITSFAPNHLDWHGDETHYFESKLNIAQNQTARDTAIYPAGHVRLKKALAKRKAKLVAVGPRGQVTYSAKDHTITRTMPSGKKVVWARLADIVRDLPYDFRCAAEAAQMVAAIAIALGVKSSAFVEMIREFRPLKHRIERVGVHDGVTWVNDSKSTSIDATIFALKKYTEPVILMMGGHDKGLAFSDVIETAKKNVKAIIAFGECRDKIAREIGRALPIHKEKDVPSAIARARKLAKSGDVVLFSPACSSYDQFKNYEERGDTFRKIVSEL